MMTSPSVSIRATSTPSCEVPLISPIAKTCDNGADEGNGFCDFRATAMVLRSLVETVVEPVTPAPPRLFALERDGNEVARDSGCRSKKQFELTENVDEHLQVRFSQRAFRARLHPSGLRAGGAGCAGALFHDH